MSDEPSVAERAKERQSQSELNEVKDVLPQIVAKLNLIEAQLQGKKGGETPAQTPTVEYSNMAERFEGETLMLNNADLTQSNVALRRGDASLRSQTVGFLRERKDSWTDTKTFTTEFVATEAQLDKTVANWNKTPLRQSFLKYLPWLVGGSVASLAIYGIFVQPENFKLWYANAQVWLIPQQNQGILVACIIAFLIFVWFLVDRRKRKTKAVVV